MTTHNTCYHNRMQQPAIILILCQSNHHQHTTTTSSIIIITATITVSSTPMSIISLTSSVSSGKQHAHLLREFYGIDGDTPEQQDSTTTHLSWQFDGAQSLFEVSARLANGKQLLSDAHLKPIHLHPSVFLMHPYFAPKQVNQLSCHRT